MPYYSILYINRKYVLNFKLFTYFTAEGIWGSLLKEWLEAVIPDTVTAETFDKLQISVTTSLIRQSKLVSGFKDKNDVINACLASCHVPIFLDGRPFAEYRG